MRIIAGAWRGRRLQAPTGASTRPTADRVRQALFDMLWHAPWCGREGLEGAEVLDAFAGTGAFGLECLSRGAARLHCIEQDRQALTVLRANIAACGAGDRTRVIAGDATRPPPGPCCGLVFLDPPYGAGLVPRAAAALMAAGWIGPDSLVLAELGADEPAPDLGMGAALAERAHGAARIAVWRIGDQPRNTSAS